MELGGLEFTDSVHQCCYLLNAQRQKFYIQTFRVVHFTLLQYYQLLLIFNIEMNTYA